MCYKGNFQGIGCAMIGGEGDGVSNWTSSGLIGERSIEDEKVSLVDGVLEGALGALGRRRWCIEDDHLEGIYGKEMV
ncbi:hypothetical protein Tco_0245974 [Tanacetum coccineum]